MMRNSVPMITEEEGPALDWKMQERKLTEVPGNRQVDQALA